MLDKTGKLICKEVRIENCSVCNARCTICPREKMTRSKVVMSNEHFNYVLGQSIQLGAEQVSIFGFGEPLLDNHIAYKIEVASDWDLETHLTTNASLLSPQMTKDLLYAGLSHIRFSVHATTPANYAAVHCGLDWYVVVGNMEFFRDLNNNLGHPCTIHITCIPQHNESVDEIREKWEFWGGDYLEIWRPHNWGGKKEYRKGRANKMCFRPFSGPVQIQADGNVIPCCFLIDGEVVLGNTYNHTMENILRGDAYKAFQEKHQKNVLEKLPCGSCDQRFESEESPLLYSNRDYDRELNKLSTSKIKLGGN